MNFDDLKFWELLAAGLGIIWVLRRAWRRWAGPRADELDRIALMILSLFLLACVSWLTVTIFIAVGVGSYVGMHWLAPHPQHRYRWYLGLLIPILLFPLLYYKYAHFLVNQVLGGHVDALRGLLIPVGISFYSFQMLSFVIDTLGFKKPVPRFMDFINFASFFPQIVAGPIERRQDLLPQVERFRFRWNAEDINAGVAWIVAGLFFKLCVADNVALYFHGRSATNAYMVWMDNLIFGLRIYYDFAGYSLVAVGLGRCLGVSLTLNFHSPYCATSIVEFWRRWHITLSQWFRDYVYMPLGGGRCRHWIFNIAVVFIVSGIWHGAGWNFILWGALHGAFLIVNRLLGPRLRLPATIGWALTLIAAMVAWLCFYEIRTDVLKAKVATLFTPSAYSSAAFHEYLGLRTGADQLVMAGFLVLAATVLTLEWLSVARRNEPYYYLRRPVVVLGLIILTVLLAPGKNNAFIYFAF